MTVPATENLTFETVLEPATGVSGFGTVFSVGTRSKVCRLKTDTDDDAGADDAFQLYAVQEFNKTTGAPILSYPVTDLDPVSGTSYSMLFGGNRTQGEIVIRGYYVWKKILATTPAVGVEVAEGYERR